MNVQFDVYFMLGCAVAELMRLITAVDNYLLTDGTQESDEYTRLKAEIVVATETIEDLKQFAKDNRQ